MTASSESETPSSPPSQAARLGDVAPDESRRLVTLGLVAAGVAHDFNNVLTAILANQQLAMLEGDDPSVVRQCLEEIGRAAERGRALVAQVLAIAKRQPGAPVVQPLAPLVREAVSLWRASLPATIALDVRCAADAPDVAGDSTQLYQVLLNLLTNASQALPATRGRIDVALNGCVFSEADAQQRRVQAGRWAVLSVTDSGRGIEPGMLSRIFDPLFTTRPNEGTGLGLAIVQRIVHGHGGFVCVDSVLGCGTRFDVYLPAVTPRQA